MIGAAALVLLPYTFAQETEKPDQDPHRPACTSSRCRRIKSFLKGHYCGESPAGNGPDDGCEIRLPTKPSEGVIKKAEFVCKWSEADSERKCEQRGLPSLEFRNIVIREMHRLGLPANTNKGIQFDELDSNASGWSVVAGSYHDVKGPDLLLCGVILVIDQTGNTRVVRKVPFQKTDADVPQVATWSLLDITDVDADGNSEIVLQGDAYEDHWLEVVRVEPDSLKTIFSGLGYYL